jgi:predicted enzyme related to lactoylglutathione lyase
LNKLFPLLLLSLLLAACAAQGPDIRDFSLSDKPLYGKFVWHDLITDDVTVARAFYEGLFGWSFEETTGPAGNDYVLIRGADGSWVGGMVELADPPGGEDYSRWLGYMSVPDVDAAAAATAATGGEVLVGPRDFGQIARAAAVKDPQGAVFGLVRSRVGDLDDSVTVKPGLIAWNELLAADSAAASDFYAALAGFDIISQQRFGGEYVVLEAAGVPRAGLQQRPAEQLQPLWLTYFAVNNVAAVTARAEKLGGTVLVAPSSQVRNGSMALIVDPTGAVFGLQRLP